jgi:RNA polymerase sigma factor (sigma-70 family)
MRDPAAAADVVQESYLRLALEARAGRYPRQPRDWLHRVTLNLIISGARRAASRRRAMAQVPGDGVDRDTPESRFLAAERAQTVGTAIQTVGSRARTGLPMAAMGYSGREIASTLGSSEGATRALLCRARSRTRRVLTLGEKT